MLNHLTPNTKKNKSLKVTFQIPRNPPIEVKSFGTYVKKLRTDKGLLQKELAAEIGVTGDTIVNWEKDRTFPSKKWIKLLAKCFGVRERSFSKYK